MSIVVTGATGQLGRLVIADLLGRGVEASGIAAVVRDPDKAADLAARGVEVRVGDYDRPETLRSALRAGERVLFVSGSEVGKRVAQHSALIDAAREAGVGLLAYTGVLGGPAADFRLADEHKATEELILASELPYTFLRNGWYTDVYTQNLGTVLEHGAVVASAGEGRLASAARADYAEAAAAVLTGEGHENAVYELSGDTAWSFAEYAAAVSEAAGRDIAYRNVGPEQYREILLGAGLPAGLADLLVDVDRAISEGLLAGTSGDLARLIGHPTTPMPQSVAEAVKG
jgi:NAD(P)H dehydrogenase (quinone)